MSKTTAKSPTNSASNGRKPAAAAAGTRIEKDTMGEMTVPADVLYAASTQRAVMNFPVSGRPVPFGIISAYATLKAACARVNRGLKRLDKERAAAIEAACGVIGSGMAEHGGWAKHFPIDVFQTGSGTSTNMNVNEVIANLVCLSRGKPIGSSKDAEYLKAGGVHPNDHVNMGQSSNDTFPTALHVAAAIGIEKKLLPAVGRMARKLEQQAKAWDKIVKIGRTHLQDATPIRLGQEFSGYASQMRHAEQRCRQALAALSELAIGGTAVGTGINAHEDFDKLVSADLTKTTGGEVPRVRQPLRGAARQGRVRGDERAAQDDRDEPDEDCGGYSFDGDGAALRDRGAGHSRGAAGLEHHAGEGEPGDLRGADHDRRAGDRQRRGHYLWQPGVVE